MNAQRGFSLVELMIACALGTLVVGMGFRLYVDQGLDFLVRDQHALHQDDVQLAFSRIASVIGGAGYGGCRNLSAGLIFDIQTLDTRVRHADVMRPIAVSKMDADLANKKIADGTDVLRVNRLSPLATPLLATQTKRDAPLLVSSTQAQASRGDLLMVSDCRNAALFTASNIKKDKNGHWEIYHWRNVNHRSDFSHLYPKNAMLGRFETLRIYLAPGGEKQGSALYIDNVFGRRELIVEGLSNLQFKLTETASGAVAGVEVTVEYFEAGNVHTESRWIRSHGV